MSHRRRQSGTLLAVLSLVFLIAACAVGPAPASDDTPLYLIVDPEKGTVQQAGLAAQRLLRPGAELGLAGLSFSFEQGNLFVIEASFRNNSSDLKYRDFRFLPRGRGYVESREPTLENDQLGADGFLTPGETTPQLRFEVVHRRRPFIYYVLVDADVVEIRTDFDDLEALGGGPLIDPDEGNCMVDELVTREQGYRLSGGVGGLSIDDPAGPFDPTPVVVAEDLATQVASVLGNASLERDVAILVVDDFGTPELDPDLFGLSAADLDPPPTDPFDALDLLLDELVEEGILAHGPLVMAHTAALLSALPGVDYEGPVANVSLFGRDGHAVALVAIDTQGFRTDAIAASIYAGLETLAVTLPTIEFEEIVVNMSFNVVPCTVLADFNASGAASFDAYLALLAAANDLVGLEAELAAFTTTAVLPDPLEELTGLDLPGAERSIFVGSAGNFGNAFVNDFTLAPALWPRVIGVASLDGTGDLPSVFTNPGEVAFGGAWIVLEDALGSVYTDFGGRSPFTRLAGTSFAAPGVSVFSALDLASAARCAPPRDSTTPRLATGAAGYGENDLAAAVTRSCLAPPRLP